MTRLFILFVCAFFVSTAIRAELPELPAEWTTPSGEMIRNAKITKWDAAFATIRHDEGVVRIAIDALPEGFPQALGYDPVAAEEARRRDREAKAAAAQAAIALQEAQRARVADKQRQAALAAAGIQAKVNVVQVTVDGGVRGSIYEQKTVMESKKFPVRGTALDRHPRFEVRAVPVVKDVRLESNAIVLGVPDVVDGDVWTGVIYPAGRTQYVDTFGETVTVRMYSTTPPADLISGGGSSPTLE